VRHGACGEVSLGSSGSWRCRARSAGLMSHVHAETPARDAASG
jgi:hypothetical protein